MAKRERLNVEEFFGEIDQAQEVYSLRERVQQLEQNLHQQVEKEKSLTDEIEQIRSQSGKLNTQQAQPQIDQLRQLLEGSQGKIQYPIANMHRNPNQPRQSFANEVAMMQISLQQEGQLAAVILYPDGMIFDGECRWRAASNLGWQHLDVVFIAKPDEPSDIRRKSYLTSLHRRSLNDLDRAEALVAIICDEHPAIQPEEVTRIVNRVVTRLKRQKKRQLFGERLHIQSPEVQKSVLSELELSSEELAVFQILLGLQEHPISLDRNVFPALKLMPDLKKAVREKGLGCSQAKELNRLTSERLNLSEQQALKIRAQGVMIALDQDLSADKLRAWAEGHIKPVARKGNRLEIEKMIKSIKKFCESDFSQVSEQDRRDLKMHLQDLLETL